MKTKFDIQVKWVDDEQPDLSCLGEYKAKRPDTVYIDRKNDLLVDPNNIQFKRFVSQDEEQSQECLDLMDELDNLDVSIGSYPEDGQYVVEYYYYEELPFSCHYERNDYQYIETCNYQLKNLTAEDYKYVIQDTKRLESYGYDWYMQGCIVTANLEGIELGQASCWGYETDMDEDYRKEVIDDLTYEAVTEAKKALAQLKKARIE